MKNTSQFDKKAQQLFKQAQALFAAGDMPQALALAENLAKKQPNHPRTLAALGFLQAHNHQMKDGLHNLNQAQTLSPNDAWILTLLGEILCKNNQYTQAREVLSQACEREPKNYNSWMLLAGAYEGLGDFSAAQEMYGQALILNSTDIALLYRVSFHTHYQHADHPHIQALEQQIKTAKLSDYFYGIAHLALGKAYQDLQQPEAAFHHYQTANQKLGKGRKAGLDLAVMLRDLHAFHASHQLPSSKLHTQREVMIIGVSRSGKSLLETLLACHPKVTASGEESTFYDLASPLTNDRKGPLNYLMQLSSGQLVKHARDYQQQRSWPDTPFVTNTLPINLHLLNIYAAWFPAAPIIFIKRRVQDQGLACYFKHYDEANAYSYDLYTTGREIALSERLMDFWVAHLPNPCLQLSYEDLVEKPAATTRLLYQFLGLDWQPEYFSHLQQQKSVVAHLAPHQSIDGAASLRQDYIGWSAPFAQYLKPLQQGYDDAMLLDFNQPLAAQQDAAQSCKQALNEHNYQRALLFAQNLLKQRPSQPQYLQLAGICASLSGADQQALVFFEHAAEFTKKDIGLTINHTRALLRAGKQAEAKRLFTSLEQQYPQHAVVQQLGVQILLESGSKHKKQLQEALLKTDYLLVQQSTDPELLLLKAGLLHRLGQYEASVQQYQQLVQQLSQLSSTEAWRSAPLKTRVLLAYAQLQADASQPDAAAICEILWQAASLHPLTRTSAACWKMYKKWLQRSKKSEHQALNRLHLKVADIWQHYAADELEHSFGDYGLPYQSFEPLQLPGTRPAMARLATYGLADHLPQDARALDIGCNHGYLLMGLAEHLSAGIGFDISKACIEVGQTVAEHLGVADRIQLQHSTFDDFCQTTHQPFDLILACAVHHWINKPLPQFGRILYDWIKPGGLVLIESQGSRQRDATEPDFDAKVSQMMQPGFVCIAQGSLCDDEINYREFRLLQRPMNEFDNLEEEI